ncbi:hypothetical protein F4679DRAFT_87332 [Xylaria curta]|nr:hypothetical protein F4679DRAFT_87332 [Xylaria curta]
MERNSTFQSPIAYVEDADEDGHVLSGTEARHAQPPKTSIRSPMIGAHTILNPAGHRTQPTSLLKHMTISRDNTANRNERKSASFAYLGSRLKSHHNTSSKIKTIRTSPFISTIVTYGLEAVPIRNLFGGGVGLHSDNRNVGKDFIVKPKYLRPSHPKVFCDQCDEHKEGFRSEHELRRHKDAKHQTHIKKFICVNPQELGLPVNIRVVKPLSKCKACKAQKKYGAYYNAAAHLRRTHFREKSSRLETSLSDSKRKNKMGGDWPSMHELKNWMQEIYVRQDEQQLKEDDDVDDKINALS